MNRIIFRECEWRPGNGATPSEHCYAKDDAGNEIKVAVLEEPLMPVRSLKRIQVRAFSHVFYYDTREEAKANVATDVLNFVNSFLIVEGSKPQMEEKPKSRKQK